MYDMEEKKGREKFELIAQKHGMYIGRFVPYELQHVCPLCSKKIEYNEAVCIIKEPVLKPGANQNSFLNLLSNGTITEKETVTGGWSQKSNGKTYYYPTESKPQMVYRNWTERLWGQKRTNGSSSLYNDHFGIKIKKPEDPIYYLEKEIIFHFDCLNKANEILDQVKGEAIIEKLGGCDDGRGKETY